MAQNIYDKQEFFEEYAKLSRSVDGLNGAPEWTSVVKMLPKLEGLNIVDLGCGYGWFCRYALQHGAKHVLGVDISAKMLERARSMASYDAISYRQEDLERLNLLEDTYELVYSSLTLHYIEDLDSLIETVYLSLKTNGYFVFSVEHPIYTAPSQPGWLENEENGQRSWLVNSYQLEGQRVTNWLGNKVTKQHRLLATYLNLLIGKGYTIKHVEEWGPTSEQIAEDPSLCEEKDRPMFLLISVQKL